jgi:hypothetical protein
MPRVLNIGLYLEAELTLYAVEINVVREYRLRRSGGRGKTFS